MENCSLVKDTNRARFSVCNFTMDSRNFCLIYNITILENTNTLANQFIHMNSKDSSFPHYKVINQFKDWFDETLFSNSYFRNKIFFVIKHSYSFYSKFSLIKLTNMFNDYNLSVYFWYLESSCCLNLSEIFCLFVID